MTFGDRIRDRRKTLGLSQTALGKLIGRSQVAVSNWERGDTETALAILNDLATILRCDRDWLLYGEESSPRHLRVPVLGAVGAGDMVTELPDGAVDWIEAPPGLEGNFHAYIVRGESQEPYFHNRDVVYVDANPRHPIDALIGYMCIVELVTGEVLLKRLEPGSRAGVYNLASANSPIMRDRFVVRASFIRHVTHAEPPGAKG